VKFFRDLGWVKKLVIENEFFTMPEIKSHVVRFEAQLARTKVLPKDNHILIRGPRGAGKSHFIEIFKKRFPLLKAPAELTLRPYMPSLQTVSCLGMCKTRLQAQKKNRLLIISPQDAQRLIFSAMPTPANSPSQPNTAPP